MGTTIAGIAQQAGFQWSVDLAGRDSPLNVRVQTGGGSRLLYGQDSYAEGGWIGLYSVDGDDPSTELFIWVRDDEQRKYPVALDRRGHLFIKPEPYPADAVIQWGSGVRLDLGSAQRIGRLAAEYPRLFAGARTWTLCRETDPCLVRYTGPRMLAPLSGTVRCMPDGRVEVDGGAVRLQFQERRMVVGGWIMASCAGDRSLPSRVEAGAPFLRSGHYWITGVTVDGEALALAAADDGTLYAGDIPPRIADCPCRLGS